MVNGSTVLEKNCDESGVWEVREGEWERRESIGEGVEQRVVGWLIERTEAGIGRGRFPESIALHCFALDRFWCISGRRKSCHGGRRLFQNAERCLRDVRYPMELSKLGSLVPDDRGLVWMYSVSVLSNGMSAVDAEESLPGKDICRR